MQALPPAEKRTQRGARVSRVAIFAADGPEIFDKSSKIASPARQARLTAKSLSGKSEQSGMREEEEGDSSFSSFHRGKRRLFPFAWVLSAFYWRVKISFSAADEKVASFSHTWAARGEHRWLQTTPNSAIGRGRRRKAPAAARSRAAALSHGTRTTWPGLMWRRRRSVCVLCCPWGPTAAAPWPAITIIREPAGGNISRASSGGKILRVKTKASLSLIFSFQTVAAAGKTPSIWCARGARGARPPPASLRETF